MNKYIGLWVDNKLDLTTNAKQTVLPEEATVIQHLQEALSVSSTPLCAGGEAQQRRTHSGGLALWSA